MKKNRVIKSIVAIIVAMGITISLAGCFPSTPQGNRNYAMHAMRQAGLSSRATKFFDCVGYRESRWQEKAVSRTNDRGLFQINAVHATQFRQVTGHNYYTGALDRVQNTKYTIWLYKKVGVSPWKGHTCRF